MKDIAIANVRTFALLGHTGNGKTTLLDAIIHKMGASDRKGDPADGTSVLDYTDEEKDHQITVWAKPFSLTCKTKAGRQVELVAIDTPGYADFLGQVIAAKTVAGAGLIVVDAVSGIQVGDTRAWKECESRKLPRGIVISGLDKENADFNGVLTSIQQLWGTKCEPITVPTPDGKQVVNVLEDAGAPDEMADQVKEYKGKLVEFAAETNDALLEKFFNDEELSAEEIAAGLHEAVHDGSLIPVFAASGKADVGIDELMDGVSLLFPSPEDNGAKDAEGNDVDVGADAPFCGLVWKSVNDPFSGQLSFIRVYGGTLTPDTELFNSTNGSKERVGHIYVVNGKKNEEIKAARAGDIVAIPKLKNTSINDSVCAAGQKIQFKPIAFPQPVTAYAIESKTRGDEDKMMTALQRAADEDPTVKLERNPETSEFIIAGMGDVQLDVALERMKKSSQVEVDLSTPKVAYKETINANGEGHYKHKKQSGGRGQYGEVYLRVEPKDPAEEDWFINAIVGGAIPSGFIPAVQKGLNEGLAKGAVAGYPVLNVKITLYDGSYHDVDSSEIAFKIAGARALRDALSKAKPVLLEPIMSVKVLSPEEYMGDINGALNHKRGRILGMGAENGVQVIEADVPQAEMFKFSSELRSMTSGRGSFEMTFSRYEVVPQNIAQKVVDARAKEQEEED